MIIREGVLREYAFLGFDAYVKWKKKEFELKRTINVYLDNMLETYLIEKDIFDTICDLQLRLDELSFVNCSTSKSKDIVIEFFKPLEVYIEVKVDKINLYNICKELDHLKELWELNVHQGVSILEMMQNSKKRLAKRKCTPSLLLVILHYFSKNEIYFSNISEENNNIEVVSQVIYPKNKLFNRFKKVFNSSDSYKAEFEKFWINEYPEYVIK